MSNSIALPVALFAVSSYSKSRSRGPLTFFKMKLILWIGFFLLVAWMMLKRKPIPKGVFFNQKPIEFHEQKAKWLAAYAIATMLIVIVGNLKPIVDCLVSIAR